MSQRYCRDCGAEVTAGDRFCSECGRELDAATGQSTHHGGGQQTEQRFEQETRGQYEQSAGASAAGYVDQQSDTTMAAVSHLLAVFVGVVGPLIMYLVSSDPFVKENAANATNWQIMLLVYMLGTLVLVFTVSFALVVLWFALTVMNLGFIIIGAIKAGNGETWSYPLTPKIL